jgi:hypothetical protein
MTTTSSPIIFVNWDHRPAVLVGGKAFAVLKPGGPWVPVDRADVFHTAAVMSEAAWLEYFYMTTNLSAEGIDRQKRHEWRQGYPKATEAEIQMLFDAEKKNGCPPRDLDHAKLILSDNVWVFTPRFDSPYGQPWLLVHGERPPYKPWRGHWRPSGEPSSL